MSTAILYAHWLDPYTHILIYVCSYTLRHREEYKKDLKTKVKSESSGQYQTLLLTMLECDRGAGELGHEDVVVDEEAEVQGMNQCTYSIAGMNQCTCSIAGMNQCAYSIAGINQCTYSIAGMNQCT
jgi:hypothetical protein